VFIDHIPTTSGPISAMSTITPAHQRGGGNHPGNAGARLQISLSLGATRQNDVTKRLAGWGALLAIPTMVFSIYGMNFKGWFPELEWSMAIAVMAV